MSHDKVRVRFAPSPTGHLHVGNARTALFNWLYARRSGGVFILRIEDTDVERSRGEFESGLISDLRWLGLDWDEGPDLGGGYGPYRQSERLSYYNSAIKRLIEEEKAYYCFCSPEELEAERILARETGEMPVYSGKCLAVPQDQARSRKEGGEAATVRLKTPRRGTLDFHDLVRGDLRFDLNLFGDPILTRPNGLPAYNFAVVIDDYLMRVTHVIRGEDHIANTVRQILTFRALGWALPLFAHLSMVMGEDNTRLSKRHGATSVGQFQLDGILPEALFNYLAMLGWAPPEGREVLDRRELVELFRLEKVSRSAAVFDYQKLHWINRQHIKALSTEAKAAGAVSHLQAAGLLPDPLGEAQLEWTTRAVETLIDRIDRFADLPDVFEQLFRFDLGNLKDEERDMLLSECGRGIIQSLNQKIPPAKRITYADLAEISGEIKRETGCKGKELFHPIRVALTSRASGLDLDKLVPLLESGQGLELPRRLKSCGERIQETWEWIQKQG